jgi:hypothetical protein
VDRRIADLLALKQDLQQVESHLTTMSEGEAAACDTVLECPPEACDCLGTKVRV